MKKDAPAAARILLADKNDRGLATRKVILREQGYTVETVLNGEAAWELYEKSANEGHPFDVVVTDIRLDTTDDGLELIRRIRATDAPTRVVILSCHLVNFNEQGCGADEVISKSVHEVAELIRVLRKLAAQPRRRPAGSAKGPRPTKSRSQAV